QDVSSRSRASRDGPIDPGQPADMNRLPQARRGAPGTRSDPTGAPAGGRTASLVGCGQHGAEVLRGDWAVRPLARSIGPRFYGPGRSGSLRPRSAAWPQVGPSAGRRVPRPGRLIPEGDEEFLGQPKERIRTARLRAALAANRELIELYWHIGRSVV